MDSKTPPGFNSKEIILNNQQRAAASLLVVDAEAAELEHLRSILQELAFKNISTTQDHASAIKLLQERSFTHILFSAKKTSVTAQDFVSQVLRSDSKTILVPCSYEPSIDNVFELLKSGCRGFLVLPTDSKDLDVALGIATNAEPFSKTILNAVDRNQAFSAMISQTLDRLAAVTKDAEKYEIARQELPMIIANFRACVNLSKAFAEGGEQELQKKMIAYFEKLSSGPATKLGKLRRRLSDDRGDKVESHTIKTK